MTLFEKCRMAADHHNIPYDKAEKAIRYQFSSVVKAMESGELQSVWLQYLGTWQVKPKRKEHLENKRNKDSS
jgi:nucleoid DNA-binding protein